MLSLGQRLLKWAFTHPFTQGLALKLAPKPGEGPSREEQKKGYFEMLFLGEPPDGEMMHLVVKGEGDPGFTATSRMFAESGVCLAKDGLDVQGGFWTPASAMGEALRKRLVANAGMSFEWEGANVSNERELIAPRTAPELPIAALDGVNYGRKEFGNDLS